MWSMNRAVFNGPEKNNLLVQTQTKWEIGILASLEVEPGAHLVVSHRRLTDPIVFCLSGQKTV